MYCASYGLLIVLVQLNLNILFIQAELNDQNFMPTKQLCDSRLTVKAGGLHGSTATDTHLTSPYHLTSTYTTDGSSDTHSPISP